MKRKTVFETIFSNREFFRDKNIKQSILRLSTNDYNQLTIEVVNCIYLPCGNHILDYKPYYTTVFNKSWNFNIHTLANEEYVPNNITAPYQFQMLLAMANSADAKNAEAAMNHIFYKLEIEPLSFEDLDKESETNWISKYLPELWNFWKQQFLWERENNVEAVLDD